MQQLTDLHLLYVLDRQQRLRNEAAAQKLVPATPSRTRFARLFSLFSSRFDRTVAERRPRDTAAKPIAERS